MDPEMHAEFPCGDGIGRWRTTAAQQISATCQVTRFPRRELDGTCEDDDRTDRDRGRARHRRHLHRDRRKRRAHRENDEPEHDPH